MSEVTLKEFFEEQLAAQQELFDTKLQALRHRIEDALKSIDEATKIQNAEWARRLLDLNNTKAQFHADRAEFLTRDIWERDKAIDQAKWQENIEWRRRQELKITLFLDREEFLAFKQDTQHTLTLAAGQTKGIAMMWASAVAVATALGSFLAIWFRR
jgi:hypothetical protein